jgi:hypothetical protein
LTSEELLELFVPHIMARREALSKGKRLVHYTSCESAFRIITGKQIWLRNAQMMNDFSEIQHGIDCLFNAWQSPADENLQAMLNRSKNGLRDELAQLFDGHADTLKTGTFITSLSEHEDEEDQLGRLSMWRAYGGRSGVALVLNNTAIISETNEMRVFSSPVFYQDINTFVKWFEGWTGPILAAEEKIKTLGPEWITNVLFMVFRSFALCTKHPGFAEEREWRVYYSPVFEGQSDWIKPSIEILSGVPQHVMKLELKDDPSKQISGVAPGTLLNRVIIGPCDYPRQVHASIASAMGEAGIENPQEKIWMSFIPLRHRD